jgi:hypothetical protein
MRESGESNGESSAFIGKNILELTVFKSSGFMLKNISFEEKTPDP